MTKLLAIDGEGERLDRFELICELASGGMATVFLARLVGVAGFQRLVAIKRLHPHLAKDPDFVDMFLDEARLAARIHHPNVVPIQEVGQNQHGYYLVMDYVEGATLGKLLTRAAREGRRVPFDVVLRILLDTLVGLHAAHELQGDDGAPLGIVHRDVSPQNILLGADGVARLTDFGVARAEARVTVTKTGQLKGKLAYMAPEQARGAPLDRRADLFATAIVLWEALTLRRLFKGESDAEVLNKVLHVPIPSMRAAVPMISQELDAVVMRALSRDPEERPATAMEFAEELEVVAKAEGLLASPRDVARSLDGFFGEELTGHRDGIRSLLSSAPRRLVAGAPLGTGSNPAELSMLAQEPHTVAEPRSTTSEVPSSQLSVAAMQVAPALAPEPTRKRRGGLVVGLLLLLGGAATAGYAAFRQQQQVTPIEVATSAPAELAVPSLQPSAVALVEEPPPTPIAEEPATAEPQPSASSTPAVSPKAGTSSKSSGKSSKSSSSAEPKGEKGPNTIGKNPYRQ